MDKTTLVGQSVEYLESMLHVLACPLDNSIPLSAVRDTSGKIVALRSRDNKYPVVNNIPCLIPDLGNDTRGDLPLWFAHQDKMWQEYQDGVEGVFTYEDSDMGRNVGQIIAQSGRGLYLDVGCGALALPVYMTSSSECIHWIGIDPFLGDVARYFPFVQGLGEYVPFLPGVFDGALYASTIYHMLDPRYSLRRVYSILKPEGKLFLWYRANRMDLHYLYWKAIRVAGFRRMFNEDFQWSFTRKSLRTLVQQTGFVVEDEIFLCESCPDFASCDDPSEYLTIARCK
jgi:uncharacterized protein YbaR (Trm112 family)